MTLEMAKYIKSTQSHVLNDQSDLKSILAKDAIYNAAGLVSFNLYDEVRYNIFQNLIVLIFDVTIFIRSILTNGLQISLSTRSK